MTSSDKPEQEPTEQPQEHSKMKGGLRYMSWEELRRKYDLPERNDLVIHPVPRTK